MSEKVFDSLPLFMFILVVAGLLVAFGASVMLPSQSVAVSVGAGDNGNMVSMSEGSLIKVSLDENPSTGYSWNESVTPGLTIVDSKYVSSGSGLVGAGGVHEWTIKASGKGEQQFSAIYKRSWEPIADNETTFTLNISVT